MTKGGKGGAGDGGKGGGAGGGGPSGQSKKLCQVFLRNLPLTMLEPVSGGLRLVARVKSCDGWWTECSTTTNGLLLVKLSCCWYISVLRMKKALFSRCTRRAEFTIFVLWLW